MGNVKFVMLVSLTKVSEILCNNGLRRRAVSQCTVFIPTVVQYRCRRVLTSVLCNGSFPDNKRKFFRKKSYAI